MRKMKKSVWNRLVVIACVIGLSPNWGMAKGNVADTPIKHEIVEIKDLIQDFGESQWTIETNGGSQFGAEIDGVERVEKEQLTGYFNDARVFFEDVSATRDVITIDAEPVVNEEIQEVRGAYTLTLPAYKRVQLEIDYELPYQEGQKNGDDYYVEVFERNKLDSNEWVLSDSIRQSEELRSNESNIFDTKKEKYSVHTFVANLTQWSGREIQLHLVTSNAAKNSSISQGRWARLKLIGSTFDFQFVKSTEDTKSNSSGFTNSLQSFQSENHLQFTPDLPALDGDFNFAGLTYAPDTGFAPVYINNRWFAYFNGAYSDWDMFTTGVANSGTLMLDFMNYSSSSLYTITPSDIPDCVLRGNNPPYPSSLPIEPYTAIRPYRPANPLLDLTWKYNWENGYTGVNSALVATSSTGQTRVYAFMHVEDWFKNINVPGFLTDVATGCNIIPNVRDYVYARIGYTRSPVNQAYPLTLTRCSADVSSPNINNASPIIECFQRECDQDEINGVTGAASPAAIQSGNYVYLFYTRYIERQWILYTPYYTDVYLGGDNAFLHSTICVARVLASTLFDENYSSNNSQSPWMKYYAGTWTQPGIGGFSTPVIGWRQGERRVLCNVMYNSSLSQYLMLAWNDYDNAGYLYVCSDLANPQWGTGVQIDLLPSNENPIRLVGGNGDDKNGGGYMKLYTRYTLPPPQNNIYYVRRYTMHLLP